MNVTVWSILTRLDLTGVQANLRQMSIPIPEIEDWEALQVESPPETLIHEEMAEYLVNLSLLKEWRTTETEANLYLKIGSVMTYYNVPEKHRKATCIDCGMPLAIYSLTVTYDVLQKGEVVTQERLCPPCHLLEMWSREGKSQPEYIKIEQEAKQGWGSAAIVLLRDYLKRREAFFLTRWTWRDIEVWKSEKLKDLNAKPESSEPELNVETSTLK